MTGDGKHMREKGKKNYLWNLLQAPTYRKTCVRRESEQCRQQRGVQGHLKCDYENSHRLEVTTRPTERGVHGQVFISRLANPVPILQVSPSARSFFCPAMCSQRTINLNTTWASSACCFRREHVRPQRAGES